MSTISVILPTYNRAGLIPETLESLLAQSRQPDEILVVDDGSDDATPEVLRGYGDAIRVIRQDNAGKARALNRALGEIRGDLVWIVDDDDILLPDAAEALAGALDADATLDYCCGRHVDFTHDPEGGAKVLRPPGTMRISAPDEIFPHLLEGCHIFQPGLMVRRRVYDAVGPFRQDLVRSQDYEMLLRIARSHRGRQLEKVVFWHREHRGQRGQAGQQFDAAEAADRWAVYNQTIFAALLADLQDHELFSETEWQATPPAARPRLSLVARATVKGRQRMWPDALGDLEQAAQSDPSPLTGAERDRLARATLSSLGAAPLDRDSSLQARVRRIARAGQCGAEIRGLLRRSMRWRLRDAVQRRDGPGISRMIGFLLRA